MIERKILIGLITNTDYCNKIKSIWDIQLFESSTAKQMANWCWEYFAMSLPILLSFTPNSKIIKLAKTLQKKLKKIFYQVYPQSMKLLL